MAVVVVHRLGLAGFERQVSEGRGAERRQRGTFKAITSDPCHKTPALLCSYQGFRSQQEHPGVQNLLVVYPATTLLDLLSPEK